MNIVFTIKPDATPEQTVQDVLEAVRDHFDMLRNDAERKARRATSIKETCYYEGSKTAYQNAALFLRDIKTEYGS